MLTAVANQLRSSLLTRADDESTDPTQTDIDNMLQVMDLVAARGGDQTIFLERWMKLLVATGTIVLAPEQMDQIVLSVVGLDRVEAPA